MGKRRSPWKKRYQGSCPGGQAELNPCRELSETAWSRPPSCQRRGRELGYLSANSPSFLTCMWAPVCSCGQDSACAGKQPLLGRGDCQRDKGGVRSWDRPLIGFTCSGKGRHRPRRQAFLSLGGDAEAACSAMVGAFACPGLPHPFLLMLGTVLPHCGRASRYAPTSLSWVPHSPRLHFPVSLAVRRGHVTDSSQ
uniref:Uncharacterized protein n=1 Tax=Myotis myotis TaxID=51298 RepID=A0A7J7S1P6_MYOMY|nr:hypothetical protein mMyoMyo1_010025 [Myotis myotis]